MAQMIVMDLDGTLLTDDKNISNYTLSIFERCKSNGIKIAIATGRSEKASRRIIDLVKPDIMILNGGAFVKDSNGKIIYRKLLSIKTANGLIDECVKNENIGSITVETEENYYVSYKEPAYHPDYMHGEYYDFSKQLSKEVYKITVEIFDKKIMPVIENKFDECKAIDFSGEDWCGFFPKEVDKMIAIEMVLREKNMELPEVTAFGDDYNDMEMVKRCGTGVAMENGIEEIKKIANYTCGKNNEDGVAKWIEKNLLATVPPAVLAGFH
jgi:Cof subfamily protein (haloacid dehalogenase superfamily)